jgi:hypothetical protein
MFLVIGFLKGVGPGCILFLLLNSTDDCFLRNQYIGEFLEFMGSSSLDISRDNSKDNNLIFQP